MDKFNSVYSAILIAAIQQTEAQMLNVTEQKSYITDTNVHFKVTCTYISVIVFTYC